MTLKSGAREDGRWCIVNNILYLYTNLRPGNDDEEERIFYSSIYIVNILFRLLLSF